MRVAALTGDLLLYSRIEALAAGSAIDVQWISSADGLAAADAVDLLLVDWSERTPAAVAAVQAWRAAGGRRVVVFGPHTDLDAHAAARDAGLGPMWARSRLLRQLPVLLADDDQAS